MDAQQIAELTWYIPLLPSQDDRDEVSLDTVQTFGPFVPGELVTFRITGSCRVHCGRKGKADLLTAARPSIGAGLWRGAVPRVEGAPDAEGVYLYILGDAAGYKGWAKGSIDAQRTVRER